MSNIPNCKDRILGFKMLPKVRFYFSSWQNYERLCVHTLQTVNSRQTHHNSHSSHSNHARNLI